MKTWRKWLEKEDEPRGWLVPRGSDLKEGMNLAIWLVSRVEWSPLGFSGGRFRRIGGRLSGGAIMDASPPLESVYPPSWHLYGFKRIGFSVR